MNNIQIDIKNADSTIVSPNFVEVGKIGGAYGILGWMKIISFTSRIDDIFNYCPWLMCSKTKCEIVQLEQWKLIGKKCYIAKVRGISNRESAQSLTNYSLMSDVARFPCLYDNEYYYKDLIQCKVIDVIGDCLGYVIDIIETPANDVLVIEINQLYSTVKKRNCLIPFIYDKVIKNVDLLKGIIVVDWSVDF